MSRVDIPKQCDAAALEVGTRENNPWKRSESNAIKLRGNYRANHQATGIRGYSLAQALDIEVFPKIRTSQ
jgi:hypothetical protein